MCVVMCRQVVYVLIGSKKIVLLCVGVCRHVSAGCLCVDRFKKIDLCVSVCRHVSTGVFVSIGPRKIDLLCVSVCRHVSAGCLCVSRFKKIVLLCVGVCRRVSAGCVGVCRCVRKIVSLCVSVCCHVSSGCFFVSIYVDMCRQSFCVSAVRHPKNIQMDLPKKYSAQHTQEKGNTIIEKILGKENEREKYKILFHF